MNFRNTLNNLFFCLLLLFQSCGGESTEENAFFDDNLTETSSVGESIKKIVFFGDSLTKAPLVVKNERYTSILQEQFDAARLSNAWKILNESVTNRTSKDGLEQIDETLERLKPDIVFIALGHDDYLEKEPSEETERNLKHVIEKIRAKNATPILAGVGFPRNWVLSLAKYFSVANRIARFTSWAGIASLLSNAISSTHWADKVNRMNALIGVYERLGKNTLFMPSILENIPGPGVRDAISGYLCHPDYMSNETHPNAQAHEIIANDIYTFLQENDLLSAQHS